MKVGKTIVEKHEDQFARVISQLFPEIKFEVDLQAQSMLGVHVLI